MSKIFTLSLLVLVSSLCFSCATGDQEMIDSSKVKSVQLGYQDASVPPQYHRSYTLTFEADQIHITVDSYGDILFDTIVKPSDYKLSNCVELINKYKIKNDSEKPEDDEGCTGGTGLSVVVEGDSKLIDGYNYYCGGGAYGDLSGDVESLQSDLEKMIPNFSKYLN